jgi:regulator of cell morphogenesis and NO signaling
MIGMIKISLLSVWYCYIAFEIAYVMESRNVSLINSESVASDIVKKDYRTAAVFKNYGIEYCCGAKWPLRMVCEMRELELDNVLQDLRNATRTISISTTIPFDEWEIDFLTDYIVKVHHRYLQQALPKTKEQLERFVEEHKKKYPYLEEITTHFSALHKTMIPHLVQEEEIIFPYIRHIAHAYTSKESYASLLVRTLRKPIEDLMHHEHSTLEKTLLKFRSLTNNYTPPEAACTSHRLAYSLLQELDDDLVQHIYLENEILFPKAIVMEKELLQQ